ncbi:hypothetical protein [Streptomyces sp. NPDC023838]
MVQLAVAIVLGARSALEAEQLQLHHQGLFGAPQPPPGDLDPREAADRR